MNWTRRQRNTLFPFLTALAAASALCATACDPHYNDHPINPSKGTGGSNNPGTGGVAVSGSGGNNGAGTGGNNSVGTGGGNGDGTGGNGAGGGDGTGGNGAGGDNGGMGGMNDDGGSGTGLIPNGDFGMANDAKWTFKLQAGSGNPTHGIMGGQYCVTAGQGQSIIIGWPDAAGNTLQLPSGASYVFSYQVSISGSLTVDVKGKVGLFVDPYTADYENTDIMNMTTNGSRSTFTHMFTTKQADNQAGIGMFIDAKGGSGTSQVCFDNISLNPS